MLSIGMLILVIGIGIILSVCGISLRLSSTARARKHTGPRGLRCALICRITRYLHVLIIIFGYPCLRKGHRFPQRIKKTRCSIPMSAAFIIHSTSFLKARVVCGYWSSQQLSIARLMTARPVKFTRILAARDLELASLDSLDRVLRSKPE